MGKKLHRIKEILLATGHSQYWLAKQTGITYNSINSYFNNKVEPSLTNLEKISKALKVDGKELINF
jgi:putative transcriptional regulator